MARKKEIKKQEPKLYSSAEIAGLGSFSNRERFYLRKIHLSDKKTVKDWVDTFLKEGLFDEVPSSLARYL